MSKRVYVAGFILVAVIFAIFQLSEPAYHMLHIPPHIRQPLWLLFVISGIVLLLLYLQPLLKPEAPKQLLEGTLNGKVLDYQTNRIGDIDKLLIETKQQKIWIHFPPHTAKYVMEIGKKGSTVELFTRVAGKRTIDNQHMPDLISIKNGSASFLTGSVLPQSPATGAKITLTGKPGRYKLDEKGLMAGIIIDNYLVDISPHLVENIFPIIKNSQHIIVTGYERNRDEGFVNITGLIMLKPFSISIDKTDYLL